MPSSKTTKQPNTKRARKPSTKVVVINEPSKHPSRKPKKRAQLPAGQVPIGGNQNVILGARNRRGGINTIGNTSRGDSWSKLSSYFGSNNMQTLRYLLSPAEEDTTHGFPDDSYNTSGIIAKRDIQQTLSLPSAIKTAHPDTAWNCAILTLPSPDTPAFVIYWSSVLGTAIPWRALETTETGNNESFSAVLRYSDVSEVEIQTSTFSNTGRYIPSSQVYIEGPANFFSRYVTSSQYQNMKSIRVLGPSLTTYLNTNATQNKGIVYCKQLNRFPQHTVAEHSLNVLEASSASTVPTKVVAGLGMCTKTLSGLPANVNQMDECYEGQAYLGSYCVSKYYGNSKPHSFQNDRCCIALSANTIGNFGQDEVFPLFAERELFSFDRSAGLGTVLYPHMGIIDDSFSATLTVYIGLDPEATVTLKMCQGFEFDPILSGPYHFMSHKSPPLISAFDEVAKGFSQRSPPGGPASANDFWSTFKSIVSGTWDVIKIVAPVLLPLLM